MNRRLLLLAPIAAVAMAYAPVTTFDGIPLRRPDATDIKYFVNRDGAPAGPVLEALQAAANSWSGVPSSIVKFAPVEVDTKGADPFDGRNMIVFSDTPENRSVAGSAIAVAVTVYFEDGEIYESDIVFNPAYRFSTDQAADTFDIESIAAHEMGHALGANHSGILAALMYHATSRGAARPTIGDDDKAFLTDTYPSEKAAESHGVLWGKVALRTGEAARGALIVAYDAATGVTVGGLTSFVDGSYLITAPRGTYHLYAEPLDGPVRACNVYSFDEPVDAAFRTAFHGELSSPLPVAIDTEADILVDGGASGFALEFIGANGRIGPGAVHLPSGEAAELILAGSGLVREGARYEVRMLGAGITARADSLRVDPTVTIDGEPVLRVTVDIEARDRATVGGVMVVKDGVAVPLSGSLSIAPVTRTQEITDGQIGDLPHVD